MAKYLSARYLYLTLLAVLVAFTSGCASMGDSYQVLPFSCDLEPCEVSIPSQKRTFQSPGFEKVERGSQVQVIAQHDGQVTKQFLKGELRWTESILPNLILGLFGPAGWAIAATGLAVDYSTGNIFDLPAPTTISFESQKQIEQVKTPEKERIRIIIAPVQSDNLTLSELAATAIADDLRKRIPDAQIDIVEDHFPLFQRCGWNNKTEVFKLKSEPYTNASKYWKFFELYQSLPSSKIVLAKVQKASAWQVQYEVFDVLQRKSETTYSVNLESIDEKIDLKNQFKSQLGELVPNALSLRQSSVWTGGFATDIQTQTDTQGLSSISSSSVAASNDASNFKPKTEWGVVLTNMEPDLGRRFQLVAKWATEFSLRRTQIELNYRQFRISEGSRDANSPIGITHESNDLRSSIDQYYAGCGIGPEIGVVGPLGYLYLNLIAGGELVHMKFSNRSSTLTEVFSPLSANFGYKVSIAKQWQLGLQSTYRTMPDWLNNKMFEQATNHKFKVSTSYEAIMALGITYYFPEMNSWGRKNLKTALLD